MKIPDSSFSLHIRRDDKYLFDYQREMKGNLYLAWEQCMSVMCQMPTGTGKTFLLVSVVWDFVQTWKLPVWIVAHRVELIEQISRTLTRYGLPHGRIVSGELVTSESVQVASIQTLAPFMKRLSGLRGESVSEGRVENARNEMFGNIKVPGLLVIDEAHHSLADSYQLLWNYFPDAYKLGLTATPCRLNRRGFTSLFDRLLTSWPLSRFIEEGRLALFDYLSIRPHSEEQRRVDSLTKRGADGDYSVQEMGKVMDCEDAIGELYQAYKQFASGKKGIIYAINRAHSLHICAYYQERGVRITSIDSRTPAGERADKVRRYQNGEIDVIVNVDIFSEGFDCPMVEFIQLARPTLSLAKYLQQVGRGLRVHPDKVKTLILDQVGLYRLFGLPTDKRDWMTLFLGKQSGKGKRDFVRDEMLERQEELADREGKENSMVVIQGSEEFLQQAFDRHAEVEPFEEDGKYGLRKGSQIILRPVYSHIAPFVGKYAVFTLSVGRYGLLTIAGNALPLPKCLSIELLPDEFAYIEETPLVRYYLDLRSLVRFPGRPSVFWLEFLEFACYQDRYILRTRKLNQTYQTGFSAEEMVIDGDVFYHSFVFIHRLLPNKIFTYDSRDIKNRLVIADENNLLYLYQPGDLPVPTGKKGKLPKIRCL